MTEEKDESEEIEKIEQEEIQNKKSDKIDYQKIGLKAGLEIHQQLDSEKLFCNCPSLLRKDEPQFIVKRKLHAVAGESGKVDIAAEYQALKKQNFIYQGYDTTCLVELDEEPPHEINLNALKIALQICILLNCKIIPLTQIMRKTVIDGSNTSGFQRSLMIGIDGYVETSEGKVGVWYVYLEEDAARIIGDDEGKKIYRLDRLGIPLVEIVTAPDIKSPEHARETALKIGEILRSCKVRRGIGTIRQDINVSIKGHPRAEIKGFQDPKIFVDVAKKEIARQQENLSKKIKDLKPEVRGANPDGSTKFLRPLPGSARMYPETDLPILKIHREFINDAKKTLPNLKSDEKKELKKHGLSEEMIGILFKENKLDDYRELLNILNNPQLVAKTLLIWPKDILAKEKKIINELNKDIFAEVLEAVKTGKIFEQDVKNVLSDIAKGKNLEEAIKIEKIDIAEIEEEIHKIIKEKPGLTSQGYMGLIMKEFKGKIDGKTTMDIIRKFMK